ncbi:hypothetical protein TNCV_169611 [Trichonephila clavipes]|nr:hypothetical protein TNCV_169611 [Trichonephila clavipes]
MSVPLLFWMSLDTSSLVIRVHFEAILIIEPYFTPIREVSNRMRLAPQRAHMTVCKGEEQSSQWLPSPQHRTELPVNGYFSRCTTDYLSRFPLSD